MAEAALDINQLSPEEQLDLLDKIWDRLSRVPSRVPITDSQRRELDRRLDSLDIDIRAGGSPGIPWDEVLRQIRDHH
jgi:putative addiction module component (TIGR02574 family)